MSPDRRETPRDDEAELENIAIIDAHRTFLAALACAVGFICIVITFIL